MPSWIKHLYQRGKLSGGNLGTQEYSRRKFLQDEQADKYRKEYEDALQRAGRRRGITAGITIPHTDGRRPP